MPSPDVVMFIRHGEKPPKDGSPPLGVLPDGSTDAHSLTVRGWTRAGALIGFFASAHDGIERPTTIFAARFTDRKGPHGRRPLETVTPLAEALSVPLNTDFAVGDEEQLASAILAAQGAVLVSWEHHNIPLIIAGLGVADFGREWPDDRFDLAWVFRAQGGRFVFTQVGQRLLSGDGLP
jgi:hypothetical protein